MENIFNRCWQCRQVWTENEEIAKLKEEIKLLSSYIDDLELENMRLRGEI